MIFMLGGLCKKAARFRLVGGEDLWLINEPKRGIGKMPLNLAYFGIITRKSPEIVRFQDFLVEISGNELLLFVCLKDSQGKEKT